MWLVDLFCFIYSSLYSENKYINRFISPFRILTRFFANIILPLTLSFGGKKRIYRCKNSKKVVVSLTSFPGRISKVHYVILCMLKQKISPDKIILWLSKNQFSSIDELPKALTKLQNDVFNICFVDGDLRSHKKYVYAFREYMNDYVITLDDDIFFPSNVVGSLLDAVCNQKKIIACRYGCEIGYDENGCVAPYSSWSKCICKGSFFFGSGGGTIFSPSELYKDVLNTTLSTKLTPLADDVWLNAMARLNGVVIKPICNGIFLPIINSNSENLCAINNGLNQNDVQIKNIVDFYKKDIFGN